MTVAPVGGIVRRDVVIVGGGPAGLTAALALARGGLEVTVVEEQPDLGGQYYRQAGEGGSHRRHRPEGARLVAAVRGAGVQCLTGSVVWGVADDGRTLLRARPDGAPDAGPALLAARYIVIAGGAYERVFPFPGWELPGVTTVGLAQHLATDGVRVGRRVLVAGSGPFLLPVACSLLRLGVRVIGVAEAGAPYRMGRSGLGVIRFPARLGELAAYLARLARHRVPIWQNRVIASVEPDATGERLALVRTAPSDEPGRPDRTDAVDAVCVGYGFRPQGELVHLLSCQTAVDSWSGDDIAVLDEDGRSSRPDVFVIGETAGPAGVHAARERARAAAEAILTAGSGPPAAPRRAASSAERFRVLTERLYPSPLDLSRRLAADLPDSVRVCRCEAVTAGAVRAAGTSADLNVVKMATRAGMGICQGRECSALVTRLVEGAGPHDRPPVVASTVQLPIRPIPFDAVLRAGAAGAGVDR